MLPEKLATCEAAGSHPAVFLNIEKKASVGMAQYDITPDDLSLIARTHMVEGEEPSPANCPLTSTVGPSTLLDECISVIKREKKEESWDSNTMPSVGGYLGP